MRAVLDSVSPMYANQIQILIGDPGDFTNQKYKTNISIKTLVAHTSLVHRTIN